MNQVCIHEPGVYNLEKTKQAARLLQTHEQRFVPHNDALNKKIWNPDFGPVYWQLDSDTPDIVGRKLEEKLFKRVFLQPSWETPLVIRQKRRLTADAEIVINFTSEDSFFKERPSTLAYAYGPMTGIGGDITFNDSHIWTLDGKPITGQDALDRGLVERADPNASLRTYDAQHTGVHEALHALGLPHSPGCKSCIMYPYYNKQREMQPLDLVALWNLYGKAGISHKMREILLKRILKLY